MLRETASAVIILNNKKGTSRWPGYTSFSDSENTNSYYLLTYNSIKSNLILFSGILFLVQLSLENTYHLRVGKVVTILFFPIQPVPNIHHATHYQFPENFSFRKQDFRMIFLNSDFKVYAKEVSYMVLCNCAAKLKIK